MKKKSFFTKYMSTMIRLQDQDFLAPTYYPRESITNLSYDDTSSWEEVIKHVTWMARL